MEHIDKIRRKKRRIRIGSLNKRIFLSTQTITQSTIGANMDSNITIGDYLWAMVETFRGDTTFDGTTIVNVATHKFTIRWRPDVTQEFMIVFQGETYNITDVENYDERNQFIILKAIKRGDQTEVVNRA